MRGPEFMRQIPMPLEPHEGGGATEAEGSGLTFKKYGLTVLREQRQIIPPPKPLPTQEGFVIRGVTEPSQIRQLTAIRTFQLTPDGRIVLAEEPTPIAVLEARMLPSNRDLPADLPASPVTNQGYLGSHESLLEIMAKTTEDAAAIGRTPQELADFLFYFTDAEDFVSTENTQRRERQEEPVEVPQAFEFNNRVYTHTAMERRMKEFSPFDKDHRTLVTHTVTCLDDGSQLTFNALLATMLNRYSFPGGKETGYGLSVEEIALAAGFIPRSAEDPVVVLVHDPDAEVTLSTHDEIQRLSTIKKHLFGKANVGFAPHDLETAGTVLAALPPQAEDVRFDTSQIEPQSVDLQEQKALRHLLTYTLPTSQEDISQAVIEKITEITGADESDIHSVLVDNFDYNGVPKEAGKIAYNTAILGKFEDTAEVTTIVTAATRRIISNHNSRRDRETETERKNRIARVETNLAAILDTARPGLRRELIDQYGEQGVPPHVLAEISTVDLIKEHAQFSTFRETVTSVVGIAEQHGKNVTREDAAILITTLAKLSKDPDAVVAPVGTAALASLSVDPELLPYALRSGGGNAEQAARDILTGEAAVQKQAEEFVEAYPISPRDKDVALLLVKNIIRHDNSDHPDLLETFKTRTDEVMAALDPRYTVTATALIDPYLTAITPAFRELFLTGHLFECTIAQTYQGPLTIRATSTAMRDLSVYGLRFQGEDVKIIERNEEEETFPRKYLTYKDDEVGINGASVQLPF